MHSTLNTFGFLNLNKVKYNTVHYGTVEDKKQCQKNLFSCQFGEGLLGLREWNSLFILCTSSG